MKRIGLMLPVLAWLAFGTACSVTHSTIQTVGAEYGGDLSRENLDLVEVGKTSQADLIAIVGQPIKVEEVDDATTILTYAADQWSNKQSRTNLFFSSKSRTEESRILLFEFENGILIRQTEELFYREFKNNGLSRETEKTTTIVESL